MLALLAKYKVLVITAALLGALGVGGAGVAAANGALPAAFSALTGQSAASQSIDALTLSGLTTSASGHHRHGALLGLTHGSITTRANGSGGAYVTYTLDAGKVTSISSTAITLARVDGQHVTLTITPSTVWGAHHTAPTNLSRLQGRRVIIFSQDGVAAQIGAGNGLLKNAVHLDVTFMRNGKTREIQIDRGSVVSASATQISVRRADGVVVSEPVAANARWVQAPGHKAIQPSQVTAGASVAIVTYEGKVIRVRVSATSAAAS